MQAGTLHRGLIGREDPALRTKLNNWERTHPWPEKWPADVPYIPTQPGWNTHQIEAREAQLTPVRRPRSEAQRLYDVVTQRRGNGENAEIVAVACLRCQAAMRVSVGILIDPDSPETVR
jgi:hypothetical protein